jgi:hypothetical protein
MRKRKAGGLAYSSLQETLHEGEDENEDKEEPGNPDRRHRDVADSMPDRIWHMEND